jgi:hypothetical protein
MKISVKMLRKLIREEMIRLTEMKYNVWRTKGGRRQGQPVVVNAGSTDEAGNLAAQEFFKTTGKQVDPFTLDVEEFLAPPAAGGKTGGLAYIPIFDHGGATILGGIYPTWDVALERLKESLIDYGLDDPSVDAATIDELKSLYPDANIAIDEIPAEGKDLGWLFGDF